MKRLFAIDISGSVECYNLFHNEVKSIFDKYYQSGDSIMIWGSEAQMIDYAQMKEIYTNGNCNEESHPYVIAEKLANDVSIPRQHLILVTTSAVGSREVEKCDKIMQESNIRFQYVTSYIIGNCADLSVQAPFTRGCASKIIEIKSNGSRREFISS